jgi:hypothetical protein
VFERCFLQIAHRHVGFIDSGRDARAILVFGSNRLSEPGIVDLETRLQRIALRGKFAFERGQRPFLRRI